MRTIILAVLLTLALPAAATTYSSERCGSAVITVGDPSSKLSACGRPFRVVQLYNRLGAPVGERWEFERDTGMLLFTVQGGRVVRIDRT